MSDNGGFSMPRGDFLTLVQYDLPVEVVLFDNSSLGMVEREMLISGRLRTERRITVRTSPRPPARRGRTGVRRRRVAGPEQLTGALGGAFRHEGPDPMGGATASDALWIPPRTSTEMVTAFARSAGKIARTGGVGRVIRMARFNLLKTPWS
ncbi:thiamine pyrophosphate-dependent enzyme [Streptomyces sp. NPDC098789]|uniref:thiamine pyrophosphate-dependent enzyme n=1 Tax=Streptomyces sp. NPDC098789 TaxID=3366098 RepID=UPI0037FDAAB0